MDQNSELVSFWVSFKLLWKSGSSSRRQHFFIYQQPGEWREKKQVEVLFAVGSIVSFGQNGSEPLGQNLLCLILVLIWTLFYKELQVIYRAGGSESIFGPEATPRPPRAWSVQYHPPTDSGTGPLLECGSGLFLADDEQQLLFSLTRSFHLTAAVSQWLIGSAHIGPAPTQSPPTIHFFNIKSAATKQQKIWKN